MSTRPQQTHPWKREMVKGFKKWEAMAGVQDMRKQEEQGVPHKEQGPYTKETESQVSGEVREEERVKGNASELDQRPVRPMVRIRYIGTGLNHAMSPMDSGQHQLQAADPATKRAKKVNIRPKYVSGKGYRQLRRDENRKANY